MTNLEIPSQYRVRVKQRLRVLVYAKEHGLKPAARHFALSRTTVRDWRDRRDAQGPAGLLPSYPKRRRLAPELIPLVKQARLEHRFGAHRTRIWLQRVHGISIATQTIQRLFRVSGWAASPAAASVGPSRCAYSRRINRATPFRSTLVRPREPPALLQYALPSVVLRASALD